MKMSKNSFISKLREKTNRSEQECIEIYDIFKSHSVVGRKNKEKIENDLKEKLNISEKAADELYNVLMEVWLNDFFMRVLP